MAPAILSGPLVFVSVRGPVESLFDHLAAEVSLYEFSTGSPAQAVTLPDVVLTA